SQSTGLAPDDNAASSATQRGLRLHLAHSQDALLGPKPQSGELQAASLLAGAKVVPDAGCVHSFLRTAVGNRARAATEIGPQSSPNYSINMAYEIWLGAQSRGLLVLY